MTDARIELTIEPLVELATTGHWCPWCGLPSQVRVPWVLLPIASIEPLARGTLRYCTDCGDIPEAARLASEAAQRQVDGEEPVGGDAG